MSAEDWSLELLAQCTADLAKIENKFTNEQIRYLREYYRMKQSVGSVEIREIASEWNILDFDVYTNLLDWFFGQRIADHARVQYRRDTSRAGA